MIKSLSFAVLALALVSGCGTASYTKSGSNTAANMGGTQYTVSGKSYNPEAMVATLSNAQVQETNATQYWNAVQQGKMSPYFGGMSGDFRTTFCPNGMCVSPPAPAAPPPAPKAAPASTGATQDDGQQPVSREEFDATTRTATKAADDAAKSRAALKYLRDSGQVH